MTWVSFEAFRDEQQRIVECVGPAVLMLTDESADDRPIALMMPDDHIALAGDGPLDGCFLQLIMRLRGIPPVPGDDADGFAIVEQTISVIDAAGESVIAWELQHNTRRGTIGQVRIRARLAGATGDSDGVPDSITLPTGYVPLEEIIRALVSDFGVLPRVSDWRERLDGA